MDKIIVDKKLIKPIETDVSLFFRTASSAEKRKLIRKVVRQVNEDQRKFMEECRKKENK